GSGVSGLVVVALAVPEIEIAQLDVLGVRSPALGLVERVLEQGVGRRVARIDLVHRGGGDDEHPRRRARGLGVLLEQVGRLVLDELAGHDGRGLHVHPVGARFDREDRDLLFIVPFGPLARDDAVLPGVPGTHHELAAQAAFGKRAALVVAAVADRAEPAVVEKQRDRPAVELDGQGGARTQLGRVAETVPGCHETLSVGGRVDSSPYASDPLAPRRHLRDGGDRPDRLRDHPADSAGLCPALGAQGIGYGALVFVFSAMQFVATALLGRLSDRIGRRPILLTTMLFNAAGYVLFAFAPSYAALFLARVISGFASGNISAAQAYVADIT